MRTIRVVVADDDAARRAGVVETIEAAGDLFVAGDRLRSAPADVVVAAGGPLRTLARSPAPAPLVALASADPIAAARDAIAASARSILLWPGERDGLCAAVREAAAPPAPRPAPARLVGVAGTAGGIGATTLAAALASAAAPAVLLTFDPDGPMPSKPGVAVRVAPALPQTRHEAVAVIEGAGGGKRACVVDAGRAGSLVAEAVRDAGGALVVVVPAEREGARGLAAVPRGSLLVLRTGRRRVPPAASAAVAALGLEVCATVAGSSRLFRGRARDTSAAAAAIWRTIEEAS